MTCQRSKHAAFAGFMLLAAACAPTVQPSVSQFGSAVTTARSAEDAYFDALNQKAELLWSTQRNASPKIDVRPDGTLILPGSAGPGLKNGIVPREAVAAIDALLKPVQAYGEAMLAVSEDKAATTFNTNVDNLAQQSAAFNAGVLTPLLGKGLPSAAQANVVTTAVKDIGDIIISDLIARDVRAAATRAQQPLIEIVATLKSINQLWAERLPRNLRFATAQFIRLRWNDTVRPASWEERTALKEAWDKNETPVTPEAADRALDELLRANGAIAARGAAVSKAEIQRFAEAAREAQNIYDSFRSK